MVIFKMNTLQQLQSEFAANGTNTEDNTAHVQTND